MPGCPNPDIFSDILAPGDILSPGQAATRVAGISDPSPCRAAGILCPRTTAQVSRILARCNAFGYPVLVQGGKSGGAVSTAEELVISLERMNRIEEIDTANQVVLVEAGCLLQHLQDAANAASLRYGVDYAGRGSATIGGNIATNAGGNTVIRYGMTRDQVLGLEVVLADGTVIDNLVRVRKDNAGYDLKQLFIGSEGTLGVVTRALVKLQPAPTSHNVALLGLADFDQVIGLLNHCRGAFASTLTAFEVMWHSFYRQAAAEGGSPLAGDHPYWVIVDVQGSSTHDDEHFTSAMAEALEAGLCSDAVLAQSHSQRQAIWAIRDNVQWLLRKPAWFPFDISLPLGHMASYVAALEEDIGGHWPGAEVIVFGHAGDGNLHLFVALAEVPATDIHPALSARVYAPLSTLRGSIAAEHGVGKSKLPYLHYSRSAAEQALMKTLKLALDPNNILGRGRAINL